MTEHPPFGEWLRKQRRALDLSRQQLADQTGCAEITLRRIEGGTLKPSRELAAILLENVGISKDDLEQWVRFARGQAGFPSQDAPLVISRPQTNLPAQFTSFIGREKEQAEAIELINKYRLVSLIGMGGVGKTRLSIKVGEQLLKDFSNGVWMVELAPLLDPTLIPQTVASVFGLSATPSLSVTQVLINYLCAKKVLLILDNCEHMLGGSAQLADTLLKNCPDLKILTTSREPLGILGEASYRLPSLALPDSDKLMNAFRDFASVRLFEERAQLVKRDFSLTMENASFVTQICHRLDGIPLAIELAAVQVNQLSVKEIVLQLDQAFQILTGGSRTALPRQQTIRASIDWSWNLLTDDEHVLLRRLSVFAGGWTLESASAVYGDDNNVKLLMGQLVRKSLAVVNQVSGGTTRYHFHEVVRQYVREKLIESDESELICQKHLQYFISLAEHADVQLHGADQNLWLERLTNELSNLRAALEFAVKHDSDNAVRLSASLGWFWYRKGLLAEGRNWYKKILDTRLIDVSTANNFSKAFYGAGLVAHFQADYVYARKTLEQSLALAQQQRNLVGIAHAHVMLGMGYVWQGDFVKTEQHILKSIEIFKSSGGGWGHAFALNTLGFAALLQGDFQGAYSAFEESVNRARAVGDRYISSFPLSNLGIIAYQQGNLERGRELLEESLVIGQEAHDPTVIEWCMAELGHIARFQGDFGRATELFEAALEHSRTMGLVTGVAVTSRALGDVAVNMKEYPKARSLIQESLTLFQSQGDVRNVIYCLNSFASLAGATANWSLAATLLSVVDSQIRGMGISMSPIDKTAFDKMVDEARRAMSESVFDELWTEGGKISVSEAVALTLNNKT